MTDSIDPLKLPYVIGRRFRDLPAAGGVYFLIDQNGEVLYIGRSGNIKKRWQRRCDIAGWYSLDNGDKTKIAWLIIEGESARFKAEKKLLLRLQPLLNSVNAGGHQRDKSQRRLDHVLNCT